MILILASERTPVFPREEGFTHKARSTVVAVPSPWVSSVGVTFIGKVPTVINFPWHDFLMIRIWQNIYGSAKKNASFFSTVWTSVPSQVDVTFTMGIQPWWCAAAMLPNGIGCIARRYSIVSPVTSSSSLVKSLISSSSMTKSVT